MRKKQREWRAVGEVCFNVCYWFTLGALTGYIISLIVTWP